MPTALELTREEWKSYIEGARRRSLPPQPASAEETERERLLNRVRDAASALKRQFGAKKVILFGSLADTTWFAPDSDVDLAVEGLASSDFWRAWGVVEEIINDRSVDLIEIETAKETLKRTIQQHGMEL
jgi:predicted nucleotidyltransferase